MEPCRRRHSAGVCVRQACSKQGNHRPQNCLAVCACNADDLQVALQSGFWLIVDGSGNECARTKTGPPYTHQ